MAGRRSKTAVADRMFVTAWDAIQPELRYRARHLANGNHDFAEELLADTSVKALIFMRRSPHMITDARGFLYVVLRHVFLDATRRSRVQDATLDQGHDPRQKIESASDSGPSAFRYVELQQSLERLNAAISTLPDEQQRLFEFRFVEDLPYHVIAERLGINAPLARKRIELLRKKLRLAFGSRVA